MQRLTIGVAVVLLLAAGFARAAAPDQAFMADSDAAMSRMMADMRVAPSGDVDRDFVAMMIPHHQGAVAMAQAELRYGHNARLKRLAQDIIAAQAQEIAVMQRAVGGNANIAPTQSPMQMPMPHSAD